MAIAAARDDEEEAAGQHRRERVAGRIVPCRWLVLYHVGFRNIAIGSRLCIYTKWRCKDSKLAIILCEGTTYTNVVEAMFLKQIAIFAVFTNPSQLYKDCWRCSKASLNPPSSALSELCHVGVELMPKSN
jgi:hypothetical protein